MMTSVFNSCYKFMISIMLFFIISSGCSSGSAVESSASSDLLSDEDLYMAKDKALKGDGESALIVAKYFTMNRLDEDEAFFWYRIAAENGKVIGMTNLAYLYREKYNNEKDAIKWYCIAAAHNYPRAHLEIARILDSNKNYEEAIQHYLLAYVGGEESALEDIVRYYSEEKYGFKDPMKAYAWSLIWMQSLPENTYAYKYANEINVKQEDLLKKVNQEVGRSFAEKIKEGEVDWRVRPVCNKVTL